MEGVGELTGVYSQWGGLIPQNSGWALRFTIKAIIYNYNHLYFLQIFKDCYSLPSFLVSTALSSPSLALAVIQHTSTCIYPTHCAV
jgi:hypothetical protein